MAKVTPVQVRSLINASADEVSDEVVDGFLEDAEAELGSYLGKQLDHVDCSVLEAQALKVHAALSCLAYLQRGKAGETVTSFSIGDLSVSKRQADVVQGGQAEFLRERLQRLLDLLVGVKVGVV